MATTASQLLAIAPFLCSVPISLLFTILSINMFLVPLRSHNYTQSMFGLCVCMYVGFMYMQYMYEFNDLYSLSFSIGTSNNRDEGHIERWWWSYVYIYIYANAQYRRRALRFTEFKLVKECCYWHKKWSTYNICFLTMCGWVSRTLLNAGTHHAPIWDDYKMLYGDHRMIGDRASRLRKVYVCLCICAWG